MKRFVWSGIMVALLGLVPATAQAGNLVLNGTFATGDFTDWTTTAAAHGSLFGVNTADPLPPNTFAAYFGGTSVGFYDTIQQSVPTTAGATYTFSFWLANDGGVPNFYAFNAFWGGLAVLQIANGSSAGFPYTLYSFTETATSSSTTILFQGFQVPGFFFLDDIVVSPTIIPEPSSLALAGIGSVVMAGYVWRWRHRRRAKT
jgi:hypothetical protein